jgi:hypothetical protein
MKPPRTRPWSLAFNATDDEGRVSAVKGKKGEVLAVTARPHCLYRNERFLAWDSLGGRGTRVLQIFVGNKIQQFDPALTVFYAVSDKPYENGAPASDAVYGYEAKWDTCDAQLDITVRVEFLEDCEWEGISRGLTVL